MRIAFERMADRRPVETLVERDDGVVFRMRGTGGGAALPRDLVHALAERSLRVPGEVRASGASPDALAAASADLAGAGRA